jgi:hypothetical protein
MDKWLKKFSDPEPKNDTDNTDRFRTKANMSVLSISSQGLLDPNLESIPETRTDNTDRLDPKMNVSVLSVSPEDPFGENSHFYDFEERLAIAEHDGHQSSSQTQRIAYLDTFITILSNLAKNDPHKDWLAQKIQIALATLEARNLSWLN